MKEAADLAADIAEDIQEFYRDIQDDLRVLTKTAAKGRVRPALRLLNKA